MARRKERTLTGDIRSLVGAGVGLGIGSAIISKTGHGESILPALGTAGSLLKPVGIFIIGTHAIKRLRKIR